MTNNNNNSMGFFLQLSTVLSTSKNKTVETLNDILESEDSGLESVQTANKEDELCIINYSNNICNILFPTFFDHWELSKNISKLQKTNVLTFEIHDGDFWVFILYNNGNVILKFNPFPEYYDGDIDDDEIKSWIPNAIEFCKYFPNIKPNEIEKYFINWKVNNIRHWTEESEETKAYDTDTYSYGNGLQLFDFIKKLGIKYPVEDNEEITGDIYKIKTKNIDQEPNPYELIREVIRKSKRYNPDLTKITEVEFEFLTGYNYRSYIEYFSNTFYCGHCRERHSVLKPDSRFLCEQLAAEVYGECGNCGNEISQGYCIANTEKLRQLFE